MKHIKFIFEPIWQDTNLGYTIFMIIAAIMAYHFNH